MSRARITAWDRARVRLAAGAAGHALDALPLVELAEQHFLLRRDVLDTEVIDAGGQAALESDFKPARGRSLMGEITAGRSEPAIYLVTIALIALIALCVGALLILG